MRPPFRLQVGAFLLLAALCGFSHHANGRVIHLEVSDEGRSLFVIERFGYTEGGLFFIDIDRFTVSESAVMHRQTGDFAFVLVRHDWSVDGNDDAGPSMLSPDLGDVYDPSNPDSGVHSDKKSCFHHQQGKDMTVLSNATTHSPVQLRIQQDGDYKLYFSNCLDGSRVGFRMALIQYNQDTDGTRDYLGTGMSSLPTWYFFFGALFVAELVGWVHHLRSHTEFVRQVHHWVTGVIVLKSVSLFVLAMRYNSIKNHGIPALSVEIPFLAALFLKQFFLFVVIILLGSGWSFLKPYTSLGDKVTIALVILLQLWVNVGQVVTTQMWKGSKPWQQWMQILRFCDIGRCCLTLFPVMWSIKTLRKTADVHGKAASLRWAKLQQWYLLVLVSYFYFSRFASSFMASLLSSILSTTENSWAFSPFQVSLQLDYNGYMFQELAALVFYCAAGFVHRPRPPPPPLYVYRFPGSMQSDGAGSHKSEPHTGGSRPHAHDSGSRASAWLDQHDVASDGDCDADVDNSDVELELEFIP